MELTCTFREKNQAEARINTSKVPEKYSDKKESEGRRIIHLYPPDNTYSLRWMS